MKAHIIRRERKRKDAHTQTNTNLLLVFLSSLHGRKSMLAAVERARRNEEPEAFFSSPPPLFSKGLPPAATKQCICMCVCTCALHMDTISADVHARLCRTFICRKRKKEREIEKERKEKDHGALYI